MLFNECNDCWEGCVGWEHSSLANVMSVYTSFLCRGNKHHSDHWSSSEMQLSAAAPHCYLWSPTTTDVVMMQSRDSRIWGWKHAHIMMAGQFYHHEQAWPCPYIGLTPGSSLQLKMDSDQSYSNIINIPITKTWWNKLVISQYHSTALLLSSKNWCGVIKV